MLRYVIGLVALIIIFSACESEFKLTGDYQEKALVYGLLDPRDNPSAGGNGHLFRIQKAFLGEESAFLMALQPDSNYFRYDELLVQVVEFNGSAQTNVWNLDTINISNKDTGDGSGGSIDFFGPVQRLYKLDENINPNLDYEVRLIKTTGQADSLIADARTSIVKTSTFKWNTPNQNSPAFPGTTRQMDLFNSAGQFRDYTIRFDAAERARQYELWVRFHYREVISGVETEKSLEWRITTFELETGVASWQVQLSSEGIYSRIGSSIPVIPNAIRYIGLAENSPNDAYPGDNQSHDFDFFIRLAGNELYEYIDINNPSNTGVLQDKPVYTNVNNGLGIFSSRTTVEFKGMWLSASAGQQLVGGTFTDGLGFIDD